MANKEKNFASAVVYVHNAENRIEDFLKMLIGVMQENFEHSEIICVNDSSDDDSLKYIKSASAAATTCISVINMSYFHGVEMAMNAGVDMAIGDFVFEFDNTNLDFDPSMIMEIYRQSLKGYDIVRASPKRKERLSSRVFYSVFAHYSDVQYKMTTESFRVLSRRVINRISAMNMTVPYRKAVYANCGLNTKNIDYPVEKKQNESLDSREKKYRSTLAVNSLILFTEMGYSFAKFMTVVMMLVSFFMTVYSIVIYTTASPVAGWTTTVLFLSIGFFCLFGILTIVIKYLQLLVELVFKRKHYSFESIEKLTK